MIRLTGHGIGVYCHTLDTFLHLQQSETLINRIIECVYCTDRWLVVLRIDRHLLQLVQCIEAVEDSSKQSVLEVQLRLGCVGDEELAGIGSRPIIRHGHHAPLVVLQVLLEFILELPPVYRLASLAGACGVPRLHDESFDVSVEQVVVVVITGGQGEEVLARSRTLVAEQLYFDVPGIGVQGDRHSTQIGRWMGRWMAEDEGYYWAP